VALEGYRLGGSQAQLRRLLSGLDTLTAKDGEPEERIKDLVAQALAWITADEPERARKLASRLHEVSFGIWHGDDDQICAWTEWWARAVSFDKALISQAGRLAGTIALLQREGRGSGQDKAAKTLLKTVTHCHPSLGISLKRWMLDKHGLRYNVSVAALVHAALTASEIPIELVTIVTQHLLVPFQRNCDTALARLVGKQCYATAAPPAARELLKNLGHAIEHNAFPSIRYAWWRSLADGVREAGGDATWLESKLSSLSPTDEESRDYPALTLTSGETISESQAAERITSLKDFVRLMDETADTNIPWYRLLRRVTAPVTEEQADALLARKERIVSEQVALTYFAEWLVSLGRRREAEELCQNALMASRPVGWHRWYDGGTRIYAWRGLLAIDRPRFKDNAFAAFIEDYLGERVGPQQIVTRLEQYTDILFADNVPIGEIFKEVQEHFSQLYEVATADSPADSVFSPHDEMGIDWMLLHLVAEDLCFPVAELQAEAHRALCAAILSRTADGPAVIEVRKLLLEDDDRQGRALAILQSIEDDRPDFVTLFFDRISELTASPSLTVRRLATRIASRFDLQLAEIDPLRSMLPATYLLTLPKFEIPTRSFGADAVSAHDPLPDTRDPLEIVNLWRDEIEILAKRSGVTLENLVARMIRVMRSLRPEEEWNKAAEQELQNWLKAARLELSYRRPRATIGQAAFARVVGELLDAGVIDANAVARIRNGIDLRDTRLALVEPADRPFEIALPVGKEMGTYPRKDWYQSSSESLEKILTRLRDGRYILGESTHFVRLDWRSPTERRFMMVCLPDYPIRADAQDGGELFPSLRRWLPATYPHASGAGDYPTTIIRGFTIGLDVTPDEWIALNPAIGRQLGWIIDPKGLFRWRDEHGQVMVESVWWRDGPIHRAPPRIHEICSEGWFVAASPDAARAIVRSVLSIGRLSLIVREIGPQEDEERLVGLVSERGRFDTEDGPTIST
jgi:hypothetical protein